MEEEFPISRNSFSEYAWKIFKENEIQNLRNGEEDSRRDKLQVEWLHVKDDAKDEEDETETEKRKKSKYEVTTN